MLSCQVLAARRRHCLNSPRSATQRDRNTQTFLPQSSGSLRPLCLNDVHEGASLNCRQTGHLCLRWTLTPPWTSAQAARHRQVHSHLSCAEFEDGKQSFHAFINKKENMENLQKMWEKMTPFPPLVCCLQ